MIPIYRAKTIKQDYNEWEECQELKKTDGVWYAIGFYDCKREVKTYLGDWEITHLILIRKSTAISEVNTAEIIDKSTLSIHFLDMLDSQGNKIFASLQEDGKGGDLVVSKSYPFYGDSPEIRDSSGKCRELNYKGLLLFGSNGCLIDFVKVSDRVRGGAVGYIVEDFNEYKIVGVYNGCYTLL